MVATPFCRLPDPALFVAPFGLMLTVPTNTKQGVMLLVYYQNLYVPSMLPMVYNLWPLNLNRSKLAGCATFVQQFSPKMCKRINRMPKLDQTVYEVKENFM